MSMRKRFKELLNDSPSFMLLIVVLGLTVYGAALFVNIEVIWYLTHSSVLTKVGAAVLTMLEVVLVVYIFED